MVKLGAPSVDFTVTGRGIHRHRHTVKAFGRNSHSTRPHLIGRLHGYSETGGARRYHEGITNTKVRPNKRGRGKGTWTRPVGVMPVCGFQLTPPHFVSENVRIFATFVKELSM